MHYWNIHYYLSDKLYQNYLNPWSICHGMYTSFCGLPSDSQYLGYIVLNGITMHEWWTEKDLKGSSQDLIQHICMKGLRKIMKPPLRIASAPAEIQTENLLYTSLQHYSYGIMFGPVMVYDINLKEQIMAQCGSLSSSTSSSVVRVFGIEKHEQNFLNAFNSDVNWKQIS